MPWQTASQQRPLAGSLPKPDSGLGLCFLCDGMYGCTCRHTRCETTNMYIGLREFRSVRGLKALGLQSRAFGRVGPKLLCRVRGFGLMAARARAESSRLQAFKTYRVSALQGALSRCSEEPYLKVPGLGCFYNSLVLSREWGNGSLQQSLYILPNNRPHNSVPHSLLSRGDSVGHR